MTHINLAANFKTFNAVENPVEFKASIQEAGDDQPLPKSKALQKAESYQDKYKQEYDAAQKKYNQIKTTIDHYEAFINKIDTDINAKYLLLTENTENMNIEYMQAAFGELDNDEIEKIYKKSYKIAIQVDELVKKKKSFMIKHFEPYQTALSLMDNQRNNNVASIVKLESANTLTQSIKCADEIDAKFHAGVTQNPLHADAMNTNISAAVQDPTMPAETVFEAKNTTHSYPSCTPDGQENEYRQTRIYSIAGDDDGIGVTYYKEMNLTVEHSNLRDGKTVRLSRENYIINTETCSLTRN